MTVARQLKLGFILHGNGVGWGDWRHSDANAGGSTDFKLYKRQAQLAEVGKFDFLFVADSGVNSQQSAVLKITKAAQAEGLTLRQVALRFATPRNAFTGTPKQVADALQAWFEGRAADGFVTFESLPGQLELFVETVVPMLRARGIFRQDYEGATLRQRLGLPFPENRHTVTNRQSIAAE